MAKKEVGINQRAKEYPIVVNEFGKREIEHRFVWRKNFGEIPKGFVIHHKNGNKKDNRIENLECLSILEHEKKHKQIKK